MALNNVVMMGRLTDEVDLRTTPSGIDVASFSVALDRGKDKDGNDRGADFIPVVAWRNTALFISNYFHKGQMIAIKGSLQSRKFEDKNGNKRTAIEVVADSAYFCGSKAESGNAQTSAFSQSGANDFSSADISDEDLPF